MPTSEEIEKVRQEIMRFRELLNIMRQNLDDGERAYTQLFSNCSSEDRMKIAWRYERLGEFGGARGGHSFVL